MSLLPDHPKRVAARQRALAARRARARLKLRDPAPHRHWIRGPDGWTSEPWGEAAILSTLQGGGYFRPNVAYAHDFASMAAARFAGDAQKSLDTLLEEIKNG